MRLGYKASVHRLYLCLFSIVSLEINTQDTELSLGAMVYSHNQLDSV